MSGYAKRVNNLTDWDRAYATAVEELGEIDDPQMLLIRGQLLFESVLNTYVCARFPRPEYVHEAQLNFRQLFLLAHGLQGADRQPWIWEFMDRLSRTRNYVVHSLGPKNWRKWADGLIDYARPHLKHTPHEDFTEDLRMTLLLSFVAIHNVLRA